MIRRSTKYALEALGVLVAAAMLLIGVAVWQLSTGPISLNFLTSTLEAMANAELETGEVEIGETVLDWSEDRTELLIYFRNVVVKDGSGEQALTVPRAFLDLRLRSLLLGELAPRAVGIFGVSARAVRRPDTGVELALVSRPDEGEVRAGPDLGQLLAGLADEAAPGSPFRYLERVIIRRASVTFVDQVNGFTWEAPEAQFTAVRDAGGVTAQFESDVTLGQARAHARLDGYVEAQGDRIKFDLDVTGFNPAALGRSSQLFEDFEPFDLVFDVSGSADVALSDGALLDAHLKLASAPGELTWPELSDDPIPIDEARLDVELDPVAQNLIINHLEYSAGTNRASLKGEAAYELDGPFSVKSTAFDLTASNVEAEVPDMIDGKLSLASVDMKGEVDFNLRRAKFEDLTLRTEDGFVSFGGVVEEAPRSPSIQATAQLENIGAGELRSLWPLGLAKGAREWFFENVEGGTVTKGSFRMDVAGGVIADADLNDQPIPDEALDFRFTLEDADMSYLGPMPRLSVPRAEGHVTGDTFEATIPQAGLEVGGEEIAITNGRFFVPALHKKGTVGEIELTAAGSLRGLLMLFDHEPLGFISQFGLDPASAGGTGQLTAKLSLPLVKEVTLDDVKYSGSGKASGASIPDVMEDISATDGELDIKVAQEAIEISGPVKLNGAPVTLNWRERLDAAAPGPQTRIGLKGTLGTEDRAALGLDLGEFLLGPVTADATFTGEADDINKGVLRLDLANAIIRVEPLGWWKGSQSPANASFDVAFKKDGSTALTNIDVTGEEISLTGSLLLDAEGDVLSADIPAFRLGTRTRGRLEARRAEETGALSLKVRGESIDAGGALEGLFSDTPGGMPESAAQKEEDPDAPERPLELDVAFPQAYGNNGTEMTGLSLYLYRGEEWLEQVQFAASWEDGGPILATVSRDADGVRRLSAQSSDAGKAFKAFDFYDSFEGGKLDLDAHWENEATNPVLIGTLKGEKLRIRDAPGLAKLLTVGSFTGILDTMRGDGILFEQMKVPFRVTETRIHIEEAYMVGPAIGLTLRGEVDPQTDEAELAGTIVPAYTINSILGNVPILGDLIVGRKGEGIFAATYAVKGQIDDPQVVVNPLAALAPGFLRRIFEFGSTLPEEQGQKTEEPAADAPAEEEAQAPAP